MVDMGTLVGDFRRFGLVGPAYEVIGPAQPLRMGEPQMRIRVLETDEVLDYPVSAIANDPAED